MAKASGARRRLGADERRRQLVEVALELFAERGYGNVQFADVADRVEVTPNLLYHYFPGGTRELYVEAARLACRFTGSGIDVDPSRPLSERQPANFARYLDNMLAPTPQYLMFRQAGANPDPAVRRLAEEARERIVEAVALNNLGTRRPPRTVRVALRGYLDFAESVCAQARSGARLPRPELEGLLARALEAILVAAGARPAAPR